MRHITYSLIFILSLMTQAFASPVALPSDMWLTARPEDQAPVITSTYAGGDLSVNVSGGATFGGAFRGYIAPQTLNNTGDYISMSFDFVTNNYTATTNDAFGFGFFNTASPTMSNTDRNTWNSYTGYQIQTDVGAGTSTLRFEEHDGGSNFDNVSNSSFVGDGSNPANTGTTNIEFRLEKTAAGVMVSVYQNGSLRSQLEDTNSPFTTFNTIGFGEGNWGDGTAFSMENISITAVPEPAHYAMMVGLPALLVAFFVRRRKLA